MKKTRILSALLAAAMLTATLAACGGNEGTTTTGTGNGTNPGGTNPGDLEGTKNVVDDDEGEPPIEVSYTLPAIPSTDDAQQKLYYETLGEFWQYYTVAREQTSTAARFALMAMAEAKLLESGVMLPMQANGGNYAVSKVVPYSATSVLWGTDSYRYHNMVLATDLIKASDRDALKKLWAEKKGTGEWEAAAKEYLTSHGYTIQNTYTYGYTSDPQTFDLFQSSETVDSEVLVNTYDGLIEYNSENELKPALAEDWMVSDDGLTWTFKIRKGAMWVNFMGEEVAEVTADDFVAGFQHMLDDENGGLSWLVEGLVVGVSEYLEAESDDFSGVGVKVNKDGNLEITLTQKTSYFDTMLGYGVFAPLSRAYYESLGGKFGYGAESGEYGIDREHIAYCGPYLISSHIEKNTIVFTKNDKYWNKDNINLNTITWIYNDANSDTWGFDELSAGNIDGTGLGTANMTKAIEVNGQSWFDTYAYVSGTDATSFPAFFNINRSMYHSPNDETGAALASGQTDAQKALANAAMQNQNFRLALALAFDRQSYMAVRVGDELKLTSMVNSYTPGTFVTLPRGVIIEINGEKKTFDKGTFYGEIMQAQIDADGYSMKVFDTTADGGVGSAGGYDGWYNPEKAKEYFATAIEELKAAGYEISAENPIHLDYTTFDNDTYNALTAVLVNSLQSVSDGLLVIDVLKTQTSLDYYWSTYYPDFGYQMNYNISTMSGWGPDYGDPSTYLDTMLIGGGYMLKCLGLDV